jgi:sugar phosphate isomerase/epimerase
MFYNRRKFIRYAGTMAAGSFVWSQLGSHAGEPQVGVGAAETAVGDLAEFGLQLYTLRDVIGQDPKEILRQVASFGYKQVESYEGKQGMFWGMAPADFKAYMDSLGMTCISSHCNTGDDFERKAAEAASIGMQYLLSPWVGPQPSLDDWKRIADEFNRLGGVCREAGIRFAYHNHDYSFVPLEDGTVPHDYLLENTDPDLVDFEMDIYWVVAAGADPIRYLKQHPGRWRLCHVKDRIKGAPMTEKEASCDLGTGSIDFPGILRVAKDAGMSYYIVEQERYDNSTSLQSAAVDAAYLKQLRFS